MADLANFLNKNFNPHNAEKAGGVLVALNAAGMIFAAISNTVAAATDKNTSEKDKKFLVPAGAVTGAANIGIYYAMTTKIIDGLKKSAVKALDSMKPEEIKSNALELANKKIHKAEKGFLGTGLFKKSAKEVESMKNTFIKDGAPTKEAIDNFKSNLKGGAGVLGAFTGAVVGCAVLTPIIRDVSAYFVQKHMEKKNPSMQTKPFRPYFDPSHIRSGYSRSRVPKQPLTLKNYMAFTNGSMKV